MRLSIGNISFCLKSSLAERLPLSLRPFVDTDGLQSGAQVSCDAVTTVPTFGDCLYDSTLTWRVHQGDDGGIAICMYFTEKKSLFQVLKLNETLTEGNIYLDETQMAAAGPHFALEDPLFQIWTNFLLMRSRGLLVHALGVEVDGKAYLFAGTSGVGKSTFAHVFNSAGVGTILSDDRIIIRTDDDELCAYGTPWNGEPQFVTATSAPIEAVYFLEQAPSCTIEPMTNTAAAAKLFSNCFLAGWPREEGIQFVLETAAKVAGHVRCYNFKFTPDETSLKALGFLP